MQGFESTPRRDAGRGVFYGLCECESKTLKNIERAFRDALDDHIDALEEIGETTAGNPPRP